MSRCAGAYCDLPQLLGQRMPGQRLNLARRKRALSLLSGPNKSNFRGRGIDFEEVRAYQPGDDIRTIDWRVTARTGRPHTKVFREERERPVLVAVDLRQRMFFGSRRCLKSVLACHAAALLCWAALHQGDRVGGLVFNELGHREVRPRRGRRSVLNLLSLLGEFSRALPLAGPAGALSFAESLNELRRIARPGTSVYLVSDFADARAGRALDHLHHLSRHAEISALHCSDPLEAELPASGWYRVGDGRSEAHLHTGARDVRRAYRERQRAALRELQDAYGKLGIPLVRLRTDAGPLEQLLPWFGGQRA